MTSKRRAGPKSLVERKRDRRARLYGLVYLLTSGGLAVLHDEVIGLPHSKFGLDCEQILLGSMLVLGMLGGLLLVEGGRLFEEAVGRSRDRQGSGLEPAQRARPGAPRGSEFDTRSGVALFLARRALAAASERRPTTDDALERHRP